MKQAQKALFTIIFMIATFLSGKSVAATAPTDSTGVSPLVITTPSLANDCAASHGSLTPGSMGCAYIIPPGGGPINSSVSTASNPMPTLIGDAWFDTSQKITFSGTYLVIAAIQFQQTSVAPLYYWVDDWATNNFDAGGNTISTPTRIFYSGDAPTSLNVGNGGSTQAYYSGIVHLGKNSVINAPRIWAACAGAACGTMSYGSGIPPATSASCASNAFGAGYACFYIYLLQYP